MGRTIFVETYFAWQLDNRTDGCRRRFGGGDAGSTDLLLGQHDEAVTGFRVLISLFLFRRTRLFAMRFLHAFGLPVFLPENDGGAEQNADEYDAQNGLPGLLIDIELHVEIPV